MIQNKYPWNGKYPQQGLPDIEDILLKAGNSLYTAWKDVDKAYIAIKENREHLEAIDTTPR